MDDLQQIERATRSRELFERLDDVLKGCKFPHEFKLAPDVIEDIWKARDLLDEYTVRYVQGGSIDWQEDIIPQAKYCFQLVHDFNEKQIVDLV